MRTRNHHSRPKRLSLSTHTKRPHSGYVAVTAAARGGNMCEKNSSEDSMLPHGESTPWRSCGTSCEKHLTAKSRRGEDAA